MKKQRKPWKKHSHRQTKRLRQQVSAVQGLMAREREQWAGLTRRHNTALQRAEQALDETHRIVRAVCRHSVALPVEDMAVDGIPPEYRVMSTPPMAIGMVNASIPDRMEYNIASTYELQAYIEDHWQNFTKAVHLRLHDRDRAAYMISQEAWHSVPKDVLIREVARQLVEYIKAERRR